MEITLEKIEIVKDRTGVSYKVAKEALEAANGSVIDAIINIEEGAGIPEPGDEAKVRSALKDNDLFAKIKEAISKGNVAKIVVSKDGEKILSLPLNVGVLGAIVAPWGVIFGAIAAAGFNCRIDLFDENGELIDINTKVKEAVQSGKDAFDKLKDNDIFGDAVEKGGKIMEKSPMSFDDLKEKGQEALDKIMENAPSSLSELKEKSQEAYEVLKGKGQEAYEALKKTVDDFTKDGEEIYDVRVDEADLADDDNKTVLTFGEKTEQLDKVLSEVEKETSWFKDMDK